MSKPPLDGYSDRELQDELRRRKDKPPRQPAFLCLRCGATEHFYGQWSPFQHEQQANQFKANHRNCIATFEGGCI